ncbi:hypothetical protein [Aquamicrobium sp. LC103]|uniref:hypothetical protein n=1 Tax=Aquamicrobium sp. LC103 TaxID=1120658 RepID=UPI00063EB09C|nr:hypothetical protein [Aquamicrobium sp. LC103]TKT78437.1 hypothetical protein XW59_012540 [Aquamicrobium sp. LC103]
MIVEHDADGRILHVINDPVAEEVREFYLANRPCFEVAPTPWPLEQDIDHATGEPLFEQAVDPETGEVMFEPAIDPETGEQIFAPDIDEVTGEPRLGEDGEPIMLPAVRPVMVPVMISNGFDFAKVDLLRDYVLDGAVTARPTLRVPETVEIVADGADEHVIEGLPDPCQALVDGEEMEITGGSLAISSDMPAEYVIRFDQWPFMPAETKVIARAPQPLEEP